MTGLLNLDDDCFSAVFIYLRVYDLAQFAASCHAARRIMREALLTQFNFTKSPSWPLTQLPFPEWLHTMNPTEYRLVAETRDQSYGLVPPYFDRLGDHTFRKFIHIYTPWVQDCVLDGSNIGERSIGLLINDCKNLRFLSVRFCRNVYRIQLQGTLDKLRNPINLERLDVVGISGLHFVRPTPNGALLQLDQLELTGGGEEYDYDDTWREVLTRF